MKPRSQKLIASWVALLGLAVLLGGGVALKELAVERWFLWKLEGEDEEARQLAARKLAAMGSRAAIPRLVQIFREAHEGPGPIDPDLLDSPPGARLYHSQQYIIEALTRIGPSAVPAIDALLRDEEFIVRGNVAFYLGESAPLGRDRIAALAETLKDQNKHVQRVAGFALVNMGRPAVPALRDLLADDDKFVRGAALVALAKIESRSRFDARQGGRMPGDLDDR